MTAPVPPGLWGTGQLPPLLLTTARWRNRGHRVPSDHHNSGGSSDTKWRKVLAHKGPYEQFAYGRDHPSTWPARGGRDEGPLQKCLICSFQSGVIAVDVDRELGYTHPGWAGDARNPGYPDWYEPGFLDTRTARLIGRAQAWTTHGRGYHVVIDARGLSEADWPVQVPIAGADIKSKGFVPLPGCEHHDGRQYEPVRQPGPVRLTPELISAIKADQADHHERRRQAGVNGGGGPGGDGGGHDGEIAGAVLSMVLRGLSKQQCYAEWLKIAIPRDPGYPFTDGDFERHHGGAVRKAEQTRADEWQAWAELMTWRAK
jgi:hypothetical protein